jgi:hypothetical protein
MSSQITTLGQMIDRYYTRGAGQRVALSAILKKSASDVSTSSTGIINTVYGAAVFNWLQFDKNIWSLLPKVPWNQTGFRAITAEPAALVSDVAETGAFPDTIQPTIEKIAPIPKWNVTHWAITEKAQFLSDRDDGLKDAEAYYRKWAADAHVRGINKALAKLATAAVEGTQLTPIDRVCGSYDEITVITGQYATAEEGDIYGLDRDEDSAGKYDAVVDHGTGANGAERPLTLAMIDEMLGKLRSNGAGDRLIAITGYKTLNAIQGLLKAQYTAMPKEFFVKTLNGVESRPGVQGGFEVATYNGCPFFLSRDAPTEPDAPTTTLPRIFFVDLDHLHIKLGIPTTYVSTSPDDFMLVNAFKSLYAFYTVAETEADRFNVHGKIRDITAT